MRLLVLSFLFCSTVFAQQTSMQNLTESNYQNKVKVSYTRNSSSESYADYNAKNSSHILNLNLSSSFTEIGTFHAGTSFISRQHSSPTEGSLNVSGLGDLKLGYDHSYDMEVINLLFGANASISPGSAEDPTSEYSEFGSKAGNNFSGYNTIAPFVGTQGYVGQISFGGQAEYKYFSQGNKSSSRYNLNFKDWTQINLTGFVEVPLYKFMDIGMRAGIGNAGRFGSFWSDSVYSYRAGIYSNIKIDKASSVAIDLNSRNEKVPYEQNSTDITVGLVKTL